jgi:hypothetical protein
MAIKITEDIIKEYAERNDLPTLYEKYKEIKSDKDLKKFQRENKFALQAIEGEQKGKRREERLAEIREKDPLSFGVTDEEIVEAMPEDFTKIESEDVELDYGIPKNLFIPKGDYTNKEWIGIMRQRFKEAGLDFDKLEDRRRAAEAQSKEEGREGLREVAEEEGGFSAEMSPRSIAKLKAGKQIEEGDVASDVLRMGEAAPIAVAAPSIVGRNVLEAYLDEGEITSEGIQDAMGKSVSDIGKYTLATLGGGVLGRGASTLLRAPLKAVGGGLKRGGERVLEDLVKASGKGSREQVVKATQKALTDGKAGVTNPYAEKAAEAVKSADLTESQKKRAQSVLAKYLEDRYLGKVASLAETEMQKRTIRGPRILDKEIKEEAKSIGKKATEGTMEKKLDWEEIKSFLPSDKARQLLTKLQSAGLRGNEGEIVMKGVEDFSVDAKEVARTAKESQIIGDFLDQNKKLRNDIFKGLAQEKVLKYYGTRPDEKLRGVFKFVAEEPVAYERPASKEGALYGLSLLPKYPLRRYVTDVDAKYNFEDEEK